MARQLPAQRTRTIPPAKRARLAGSFWKSTALPIPDTDPDSVGLVYEDSEDGGKQRRRTAAAVARLGTEVATE